MRIAVLLSGSGTTLENLFGCIDNGTLDAEVAIVVSNRKQAFGLERARKRGIETSVIRPRDFVDNQAFSLALAEILRTAKPSLVVMAGFLCLWQIPEDFEGRVMNIHPSLLPAFGGHGFHGMNVHRAVFETGVKVSGCTVHFANNAYDEGPIILQRCVDVSQTQSPEEIAEKVFEQECLAYPEAIGLFRNQRLRIEGRRVQILDS